MLPIIATSPKNAQIMRLLIMHKVQCVQSNVQVSDGDKLMLNYDSEQKKGKKRRRKKCEKKN